MYAHEVFHNVVERREMQQHNMVLIVYNLQTEWTVNTKI